MKLRATMWMQFDLEVALHIHFMNDVMVLINQSYFRILIQIHTIDHPAVLIRYSPKTLQHTIPYCSVTAGDVCWNSGNVSSNTERRRQEIVLSDSQWSY